MSIHVQAADPIVEKAARKLLGIEGVPKEEQTKMVRRALKAVAEMVAELRADAALGRAVRRMPAWTFLYQNSIGWFSGTEMSQGTRTYGPKADTPEDALKAAGLMEVEK